MVTPQYILAMPYCCLSPRSRQTFQYFVLENQTGHLCLLKIPIELLVVRQFRSESAQMAKFMGPTWGPLGSCRPQMGPVLAPRILLSGIFSKLSHHFSNFLNFLPICWFLQISKRLCGMSYFRKKKHSAKTAHFMRNGLDPKWPFASHGTANQISGKSRDSHGMYWLYWMARLQLLVHPSTQWPS